jgi:hypothetical protein
MAVEKAIPNIPGEEAEEGVEISIVNPDAVSVETPEGGVVLDFESDEGEEIGHDANLAEHMDDSDLGNLASDLLGAFEADKTSRKEWSHTYTKGLDLLGMKIEERSTPWPGACGVFHPVLAEAVIKFQAQSIMETFPAKGPVKTQIIGKLDEEKEKQADRVQTEMNYQLTEVMTEYRSEHENMLFSLPLAGSAFKKIYYDIDMGRNCSIFLPAEDMVVSYGAPDLMTCPRYTHVMKKTSNEVIKLQLAGFYRDIDLPTPSVQYSKIQETYDHLTGDSPSVEYDERYTLLEIHVDVDLEGFEDVQDGEETGLRLPYVVTIDQSSSKVLSVYRNWREEDTDRRKIMHFVHYKYLPGLGFYGFGLIHMIGGLAKSATSILRQLVDAGTLSNLPAGLKSRGLRIKGDDAPLMPGEFRDVDVPSGAIKDNITFLPYKEPSSVLYQLLGTIVDEGRKFASVADMQAADMNNQAPVGTTLAIMERGMKVMSAVQARLHSSMRQEFRILAGLIKDFLPAEYAYELEENAVRPDDFDDRIDIIPVSDPNATTMSQRIMQYQAALQLAAQAPQMYDLPELHRQMLETMGLSDVDKIVPTTKDMKPEDPVRENMDIINGEPVQAFAYQDHKAHITVHMTAIQDPKVRELLSQSPMAQSIQAAAESHIREHLAFEYRNEIEKQMGVPLPQGDEPLPRDVEHELSALMARAGEKLLDKDRAEAQQQAAQDQAKDPIFQQQQRDLDIRESDVMRKAEADKMRVAADLQKTEMRDATERERIESTERTIGAQIGARITTEAMEDAREDTKMAAEDAREGAKLGVDIAKQLMKAEDVKREMSRKKD